MPEVRTSQQSGEMSQRFIAFVMMHAQQAGLFLGQIPHPQTGQRETNLEAARIFIDQLEMVQEKTRGNLTAEESEILASVLSDLQLSFVKATAEGGAGATAGVGSRESAVEAGSPREEAEAEGEGGDAPRKKFSKSYGS